VRLQDARISRSHAAVEPGPCGLFIRDLDSRHGAFVDGKSITGGGLRAEEGSLVRFGDSLLLVVGDVERHAMPPRRLSGALLGLAQDMLAGPTLARVWDEATRIADLRDPVLVLGESGSGKECVARIIRHASNPRGPFVGINIAAIPDGLFEAELFGHERGAFTGAAVARSGAFREASDGVLFLDEVGDLPRDLQAKLLRAIDLRCVRPLGASRDVRVNARLVTATSSDLREACRSDCFRTDLYYRLAGIILRVPPLRERRGDIVLLALSFLEERGVRLRLSADAAEMLALAPWEGNVRNLRYAMTHAIGKALQESCVEVQPHHFPDLGSVRDNEAELSEERIRWAMKNSGGVAAHAAEALGVSRTTLYNVLKRLKINPNALRLSKGMSRE